MINWVKSGVLSGAIVGQMWGLFFWRGHESDVRVPLMFWVMGLIPGLAGGILMAVVSRLVPRRRLRDAIGLSLGAIIGLFFSRSVLDGWLQWPLIVTGAVASLLAIFMRRTWLCP